MWLGHGTYEKMMRMRARTQIPEGHRYQGDSLFLVHLIYDLQKPEQIYINQKDQSSWVGGES